MSDKPDWGHGPNDPVQVYFEKQLRIAMTEYFEGDQDKVEEMMAFVKAKAEEFRPDV